MDSKRNTRTNDYQKRGNDVGGRGNGRNGGGRSGGKGGGRSENENPNFLKENDYYQAKYVELIKSANMWNKCGQYKMGSEDMRRAKSLEKGNISAYENHIPYESLYMDTRKNKYNIVRTVSNDENPEGLTVCVNEATCPKTQWPTA